MHQDMIRRAADALSAALEDAPLPVTCPEAVALRSAVCAAWNAGLPTRVVWGCALEELHRLDVPTRYLGDEAGMVR